jgi:hypothetical protein
MKALAGEVDLPNYGYFGCVEYNLGGEPLLVSAGERWTKSQGSGEEERNGP